MYIRTTEGSLQELTPHVHRFSAARRNNVYTCARAQLGQGRGVQQVGRRSLLPFAIPTQEQRTGNCSGWMSDPESFSKVVADHYVRTEYSSLSGRAEKIWCREDKKICQVDYSTGIQVVVSFVRLPDYVIARRWAHPTGPRCEYDFDCRPSGELVLRKRRCGPS